MVVAIVSPHASHYLGGMEIVTLQMARHFIANGILVYFFTRQTNNPTDVYRQLLVEAGDMLKVIEIPLTNNILLPDGTWPVFYRISCDFGLAAQDYYRHIKPDIFVTHLSIDSLFVPKGVKNILHLHGSPTAADPLMQAAVDIPSMTIAHSKSIQQWWGAQFPKLKPVLFQNGIDTSFFTADTAGEREIDILYVGRFLEHKGIDDILRAVRPGYTIAIAGNGSYLSRLREIAREYELQDSITFYDTPSTRAIQQLYKRAKIFACPSRGREGVLTTLLEAGASGCAVVTASGSGMTDLIKNGVNGAVVQPGDVTSLRSSFDALLNNSVQRRALAKNLQTEIRTNWSWSSKITELEHIYDTVL